MSSCSAATTALPTSLPSIPGWAVGAVLLVLLDGLTSDLLLDLLDGVRAQGWRELAPEIKRLSGEYGLELLAMEQPSRDPERMETAFQAAVEIG